MKKFVLYFLLALPFSIAAQPWIARDTIPQQDRVHLFFVGDIMQHEPQIKEAWDQTIQEYNYIPCFQYIAPYWKKADFVIGNLETTLSNKNFSGYPQFCAPWHLARDLKRSGIDILTTNNNHSCDKGANGIRNTIYYLDSLNIRHTGTFTDSNAWKAQHPLYIRQGQFKIALLSYTYGTNGIPVPPGQVVSMIDTFHMAREIEKARLDTATNIIVCMHWGIEYETHPNMEQKRLASFLHRCGADIVIGSHPHVVQPLEYHIEGKDTTGLTVYSLGNFISNQSKRYTNGGIGISLKLIREHGKTRYQMHYLSNYVYRPIESDGIRRYYVVPEPEATQLLGENDKELYQQFFKDTDKIINQASLKLDVNK